MNLLKRNGKIDENGNFDWKDALCDAAISAGLTFFVTLGAITVTEIMANPTLRLITAGIAAGGQFFMVLASKRGFPKKTK